MFAEMPEERAAVSVSPSITGSGAGDGFIFLAHPACWSDDDCDLRSSPVGDTRTGVQSWPRLVFSCSMYLGLSSKELRVS